MKNAKFETTQETKEVLIKHKSGMPALILGILLTLGWIACVVLIFLNLEIWWVYTLLAVVLLIISIFVLYSVKILRPQEAIVYTLFGKYYGTLKGAGIFFVNPFCVSFAPELSEPTSAGVSLSEEGTSLSVDMDIGKNKLSLKTKTINNDKQKVNDLMGNPIIVDTMVVWRVVDTAKVAFDIENYIEYLSSQCDSALRSIISLYPYDAPGDSPDEKSLRCSIDDISEELKKAIQIKAEVAGLEISDARITNMYYAPEIASAMLQRQQAKAIIDAKQTIVEGAVDIVDMALERLNTNNIVELDEERKSAMVSNLLVVLCGGRDAQPVINSGSLY